MFGALLWGLLTLFSVNTFESWSTKQTCNGLSKPTTYDAA